MLFLHVIFVCCLLVQIQLCNANKVDISEDDIDVESTRKELEEVQQKLKKIGETQKLLVDKLDMLVNLELEDKRVRRRVTSTQAPQICSFSLEYETDTTYYYRYLEIPTGSRRIDFEAKANNDVHIALSPSKSTSVLYEIVLGGWVNEKSAIRRCKQCKNKVTSKTTHYLSSNDFRRFWITFGGNGTIAVGRNSETTPFMEWTDPDPLSVQYLGYSTGWGSSGKFRFCSMEDHSPKADKIACHDSTCISCPEGPRGYPGPPGPPGRDGRDGRDSVAVSITGNENSGCTPGSQVPTNTSGGSVYVRWGHNECPSHLQLIYAGLAAGPNWGTSGNGANQLCLPHQPDYNNPVAGIGTSRAFLYSIEYQIDNFPTLASRHWHDVSCAVCKAPSRFSQLMIPAKTACPSSEWTLEYSGYLMTERSHPSHKRSLYICVDHEMQGVERTHGANSLRGLLDLVEGRCSSSGGGLPCGPYIDGFEITCAVCTQ